MFTHVVFFWLNPDAPAGEREAVIKGCNDLLKKVPTVRQLSAGAAVASKRPIVDSSYDVGLCVVFDDQAGHDVYQDHPLHNQFVDRHKAHWKRVQVYDFE